MDCPTISDGSLPGVSTEPYHLVPYIPPPPSPLPPFASDEAEMIDDSQDGQSPECRYLNNILSGLGDHLCRHYQPGELASYIQTIREDLKVAIPDRQHRSSVCLALIIWYKLSRTHPKHGYISREACYAPLWEIPDIIQAEELGKQFEDIQGIRWDLLEQTKSNARVIRRMLYQTSPPRKELPVDDSQLPKPKRVSGDRFFKFHLTNTRHKPVVEHFQLRNVIATTSRADIFYASGSKVMRTDLLNTEPDCVMDLSKATFGHRKATRCVTTLAAQDGVLVTGGLHGDYAMINVGAARGTEPSTGILSEANNAITNHVHLYNDRRSNTPRALFASNDKSLRALDCLTNKIVSQQIFKKVINCTATSPDGRLRLVVGDFASAYITDADTGRDIVRIPTHKADAFACAWSDDSIHVTWAAQNNRIYVADARTWKPLAAMATQLDCARSLRFSPLGAAARPVLVAAEAADFVHVFDVRDFAARQTVDFFGNVAGTAFSADGHELLVANSDAKFGGIMSFRRAEHGNAMDDWNDGYAGRAADYQEGFWLRKQVKDGLAGSEWTRRAWDGLGDGMIL